MRAAARERDGIPLSARRQAELQALASKVGVDLPFEIDDA